MRREREGGGCREGEREEEREGQQIHTQRRPTCPTRPTRPTRPIRWPPSDPSDRECTAYPSYFSEER